MRVTLLPREAAVRVITGSVATLAWTVGIAVIVLAIPVLVDTLVRIGRADAIPVPLALLLVVVALGVVAMRWMRPAVVVGYLVLGSAATVGYELTMFAIDPGLFESEVFLVNRPTLALVAIGVASSSALRGLMWCLTGFATATLVALAVSRLTGTPFQPGLGPTMVLLVAIVLYLTLFAIQARQRRRLPRFEELEEATRRRAASADLARRATAVVHDTVLNDLTVVMNAPDALDERTRSRLVEDLDTLEGGEWMRATARVAVPTEEQARIRNELARVASDFRWQGLTVNVTGVTNGVYLFAPGAGDALVAAVRAAFENVLKHSGTNAADVEIVYSADEVTFMISDQGRGFDPAAVDPRRLGLRTSIVGRIEDAGGRARIWSSPGAGTTVLLAVPVAAVLDEGDPSRHREGDFDD